MQESGLQRAKESEVRMGRAPAPTSRGAPACAPHPGARPRARPRAQSRNTRRSAFSRKLQRAYETLALKCCSIKGKICHLRRGAQKSEEHQKEAEILHLGGPWKLFNGY
ncbi:hypothetical protein L484_008652 [Morus notabilis]|uniref:Uncharacterized protein n=1 Tax=Morus notabilis TaxID=981085 RepID=W9RLS1_9ROSA|nr:hypothetical protein L484_008652 [Morus notabilis]